MTGPMALCIATLGWPGWEAGPQTWQETAAVARPQYVANYADTGRGYRERLNDLLMKAAEPVLGFIHDDLYMYERGWDERMLRQFDDPQVAVAGVAGGTGHGGPGMYDRPFEIGMMGRVGFRSNLRDAEGHGARFSGECDCAVLDMMAVFVRREWLLSLGGWSQRFDLLDYWICCEARRHGQRIRLVGLGCAHEGSKSYAQAHALGLYTYQDNPQDGEANNRAIWDEYRDVLPAGA